jgi:hypothetical protein
MQPDSMKRETEGAINYTSPLVERTLSRRARSALGLLYIALVLLPFLAILLVGVLPFIALAGTFIAYAFALWPTYYVDHWLFGGRGFHAPATFGLFALFVATMLWPLPLVCANPGVWRSRRWRRGIGGYAILFVLFAVVAAWKMIRDAELLLG